MGYFLTVSAIRLVAVEDAEREIRKYMGAHGVSVDAIAMSAKFDESRDLLFYPKSSMWTIQLWPDHFTSFDVPVCCAVSKALDTIVSLIHTYDGDYWAHFLISKGRVVDRFASIPNYFDSSPKMAEQLQARWKGNPSEISRLTGAASQSIEPYFRHLGTSEDSHSDRLDDIWVFTEFWHQLGISYPENILLFERRLRLGRDFDMKLPRSLEGL